MATFAPFEGREDLLSSEPWAVRHSVDKAAPLVFSDQPKHRRLEGVKTVHEGLQEIADAESCAMSMV